MLAALANPLAMLWAPLLAQLQIREPGQSTSCVAKNGPFCFDWVLDNLDRYPKPLLQHLELVVISVGLGFLIALAMALLSHRRRWLKPPFLGATGILYTVPSLAFFFLLLPITGRGTDTAIIALTAYTLQIIYRNIVAGLANVPADIKDAGLGMGMNPRQLLWRVELPLAAPEIIAGVRIATVSTVAIATLAVFAGGGGLGTEINLALQNDVFKTGILVPSLLAIAMAVAFDVLLLAVQSRITRWRDPKQKDPGTLGRLLRRRTATPGQEAFGQ